MEMNKKPAEKLNLTGQWTNSHNLCSLHFITHVQLIEIYLLRVSCLLDEFVRLSKILMVIFSWFVDHMNFNIFDHELIFITEWFVFHTFRISLVEMWNTAMTLMFTNARSYCRRKIVKMFISILSSYSFRHLAFSCLLWDLHSTL